MRKSYVYKITCKINSEFYFGSSFNAKRDSYWGSGRKIKERIAKYGKENFIKEILGEFDDRTIAHQVENQYIEKFRHDDKCLNIQLDHKFESFSEETRAKIGAANAILLRGKHRTDETRAKLSVAKCGEKNPMFGKHLTDETRAKISAAMCGEKNPWYGKHLSDETRAKLSAVHCGKHWRKNPITGKREYYD